jgi:hypothetical protein
MRATLDRGILRPLDKCVVRVPGAGDIIPKVLPEISDTKSFRYNDEPIIGRSFPIKTAAYGENRVINMKWHFVTLEEVDISNNMRVFRAFQSALYPVDDDAQRPYLPPPVCQIKFGDMLTADNDGFLCVVLKQYSISIPTDVVFDETTYMPYKFDVDLQWEVVFNNTNLPGHTKIFTDGIIFGPPNPNA